MKKLFFLMALLFGVSTAALAFEGGEVECGNLRNPVGPYDYRSDKSLLDNVEHNHFTEGVQNLTKGHSASVGGDLDYLLRAYPNHPGGLLAMSRLGRKLKTEHPYGTHYSVRCYFDRAIRLAPDDPTVRFLYAQHLWYTDHKKEGLEQVDKAIELGAEDANTFYNAGLMNFDLGHKDKAYEYAKRAYALGFPLQGLKDKLKQAGMWKESPPPQAPKTAESGPNTPAPTH